jgi:nucleotide-binding universal stress UspA family protein
MQGVIYQILARGAIKIYDIKETLDLFSCPIYKHNCFDKPNSFLLLKNKVAHMATIDFKNILFPTDFSNTAEYTLDYAISMAEKYNARLHLLHVVDESVDLTGFYLPHSSTETDEENMRKSAEKALERLCHLRLRELKDYETAVVEGTPAKEIVKYVHEKGIDLLIMGTHSKKKLEQLIFGSTTKKVCSEVSCPVLTIIPPDEILGKE